MEIYATRIDETKEEELERLCDLIDRKRYDKVSATRHKAARKRSICVGLLLRYSFLKAGNCEEEWMQVEIKQGEYGKPFLTNYPDFQYSLSHSGEWAVCATDTKPVGIDIQEMKHWNLNLAKRFYHEKEYGRLLNQEKFSTKNQTKAFYSMWTAKESAVKRSGRGIGAGISQYITAEDYNSVYDAEKKQTVHIKVYDDFEGYIVCACSDAGIFPNELKVIDFSVLCKN